MWDWITDHLFVATLPLCAIMAYCALKYAEAKAIKDYPDKYVKMSKKKFVLFLIIGTILVDCMYFFASEVSIFTLIIIIGLPLALISMIGKFK